VRVLLDTHTFLWFALNDPKLSVPAAREIANPANEVLVSPASYWEIAIKISIGKYKLSMPYRDFWHDALNAYSINILPIELRHTERVVTLPFHHKDPFDRLLIAQSLTDNLPLVSADGRLDAYGIQRMW
jgi:PIN domain nuclease of toxin-antitoxin system